MGLTHVDLAIANPATRSARRRSNCWSTRARLLGRPERDPGRLGIRSTGQRRFVLADGTEIVRRTGVALFRFRGEEGGSTVIFGEEGDAMLLGIVTLEELGLILDPVRRELRPMPMTLVSVATRSVPPSARAA
jgi:hypothetical protein